jgi:multiple sugar transport system permease protein
MRRSPWWMLAPYLIGLLGLVLIPFVISMAMALTEYDLINPPEWIGWDNFRELWRDDAFRTALMNSLVFAAIAVPLRLGIALMLALLLHRRAFMAGSARTAAALPAAVPEIAYGLLWLWLFNPFYGPINQVLGPLFNKLGVLAPRWLTMPTDARAAIIVMSLFTIGEMFVILVAARQALPRDAYELAEIEDATGWDIFRRITLPLLTPVLGLLLIRDTIMSLQLSFTPALVVTKGGPPPYSTTYLSLFVYRNAFEYLRYGYAAAATVIMLALTVAAVLVQARLLRRTRLLN